MAGARTTAACLAASERELQEREQARRNAIIEHHRTMKEQRAFAAANRERIDAEWDALTCPPRTIEGHIADARAFREQRS